MTVSQFSRALPLLALLAAASAAEAKPHRKSHVGARVPHRPHRKAVADPPDKSGAEPPPVVIRKQVAGPVEEVQVDLDRQRAIVGDPTPVMVTVRARDAAGRATDAEVSIDSDFGEVGEPVRREQGVYSAPLTLRSNLGGSAVRSVLIMVRANRVGGHATLTLEPGPPASVRVEAPESIRADGVTTFQMDITVTDAFGNPADEAPEAESTHADLGAPARVGPGHWVLDYRPRRLTLDADDVVRVRSGPSSTAHGVRLVAPMFFYSVAAKSGIALSGGARFAAGAEVGAWTHIGRLQLGLVVEGTWWSLGSSSQVQVPDSGAASLSVDQGYLPLTLALAVRQPLGSRFLATFSIGGGAARVSSSSKLQLPGQTTVYEAGWAPAASAAASLGLRAWGGGPFLELRWMSIGDAGLATVTGSLRPVLIQLGYRFHAG